MPSASVVVRLRSALRAVVSFARTENRGVFHRRSILLVGVFVGLSTVGAAAGPQSSGWKTLFNGKALDGWVNVNCAPSTWRVRDGTLVCTGVPRGYLRTSRMYENYVLEVEWRRARPGGSAAILVHADALPDVGSPYPRAVEVRLTNGRRPGISGLNGVMVTPAAGAQEGDPAGRGERQPTPAGRWHRAVITSRHGEVELEVDGNPVAGVKDLRYVKGYICVKCDGSEVEFRSIRLKPFPGSDPPAHRVARPATGFVSLFDGVTFDGWEYHDRFEGHWVARDGVIQCDGKVPGGGTKNLWSEQEFEDFVLIADWRLPAKPERKLLTVFSPDGFFLRNHEGELIKREIVTAGDSGIYLRGSARSQVNIWCKPPGSGDINSYHKDPSLPEKLRRACMPERKADNEMGEWNRFVITMTGERVSVMLNGQEVIENAWLPGVPNKGPIALQNHTDPVEFRNLFIRSLPEKP